MRGEASKKIFFIKNIKNVLEILRVKKDMIKVYVAPSCQSSKKVIQFFKKNNIPCIKRNIIKEPLTESEIKILLQFTENGINDIISTRAKFIKNHVIHIENLRMSKIYDLIKKEPTILKRPIILQEEKKRIQFGYHEDEIELFLRDSINNEVNNQWKIFK